MNETNYYDIKNIPLSERETFNNTIILLTMVKSKTYYIVGFSRPDSIIQIAFDFESELHSRLCEYVTIDFSTESEYILFRADLKNITTRESVPEHPSSDGTFRFDGDSVKYEFRVKKNKLIPESTVNMDKHITKVKNEIIAFTECCYTEYLTSGTK